MSIGKGLQVSAETAKLLVMVAIGCVLMWAGGKVLDWKEAADAAKPAINISQAATDISNADAESDQDRQDVDNATKEGKEVYDREIAKSNRVPAHRARADSGVPAGVRNAFKQRRLARERTGCPPDGCEEGLEDADSPER